MAIEALPKSTAVRLKSSQVIYDAVSVVKELVENGIDAGADAIKIIVSFNTLDSIQVTDNGCGIAPEDRELVGLRHHTSKLRTFKELQHVGSSSLGFRGEAVSSIAQLSGKPLLVTTRTSKEDVGTKISVKAKEVVAIEGTVAHPIGTTILVSDLLKPFPVRKRKAEQQFLQTSARLKTSLQAYALARPWIRFQLRFSKTSNRKQDWSYVPPMSDASIYRAAMLIFGGSIISGYLFKVSSLHLESEKPENKSWMISALVPDPRLDRVASVSVGHFVAIDGRPIVTSRGFGSRLAKRCRKRILSLESANEQTLPPFPFICLNIQCPKGAYDANVEPAKDDVLFQDESALMDALDRFFAEIYGEEEQAGHLPEQKKEVGHEPRLNALPSQLSNQPALLPLSSKELDAGKLLLSSTTTPWTIAKLGSLNDRQPLPLEKGPKPLFAPPRPQLREPLPTPGPSPHSARWKVSRASSYAVDQSHEQPSAVENNTSAGIRHGPLDMWIAPSTNLIPEPVGRCQFGSADIEMPDRSEDLVPQDIPKSKRSTSDTPCNTQHQKGLHRDAQANIAFSSPQYVLPPKSAFTVVNSDVPKNNQRNSSVGTRKKLPPYRPPGRGRYRSQRGRKHYESGSDKDACLHPDHQIHSSSNIPESPFSPHQMSLDPLIKESPVPSQRDFEPSPIVLPLPGQGITDTIYPNNESAEFWVDAQPSNVLHVPEEHEEEEAPIAECTQLRQFIDKTQDDILRMAIALSSSERSNRLREYSCAFRHVSEETMATWENIIRARISEIDSNEEQELQLNLAKALKDTDNA